MSVRLSFAVVVGTVGLWHCGGGEDAGSSAKDGGAKTQLDAQREAGPGDARIEVSDASDATPSDAGDHASDGGAEDAGSADSAPVPCGSRSGGRGLTHRSVVVAGKKRTYLSYLPASLDPTSPIPFVFVFHGFTMSGQDMYDITRYAALADAEHIGVAFPDGEGGPNAFADPWNIENPGQTVCGAGQLAEASGDDFGFIDAMKVDVAKDQCLDAEHVFSSGFSMGGYLTEHIGCYRSDMRAVAPSSGGTLASLSSCTTGHVPIIMFHGTADPVIDDACDDPTVPKESGFPPAATLWAAKNGCKSTYETVPTDGHDGGTGQCYLYDGCPSDGQVELCTFDGMGHCWAGGSTEGDAGSACPTYADATALQWAFFKKYAW